MLTTVVVCSCHLRTYSEFASGGIYFVISSSIWTISLGADSCLLNFTHFKWFCSISHILLNVLILVSAGCACMSN